MKQNLRLGVLNAEQCQRIFDAALQILRDTGVSIKEPDCLKMLVDAGCTAEGDRVRFPESVVRAALETAPHNVDIYNREGKKVATLDCEGKNTYFAPGICNIYRFDVNTGERRKCVKQDVFDSGVLVEQLQNFTFSNGLAFSDDCPPELATAYEVQNLLMSTTKPCVPGGTSLMEQKVIIDLFAAVAGGLDKLQEKPNLISVGAVAGPLDHSDENLKALMYSFECGLPTLYVAAPMIAATAPATVGGAAAVSVADNMVGLVLSQLVKKGNPYIGSCFIDIMDVRTTAFAHTAPEFTLGTIAVSDVLHYLGLPTLAHLGTSDSTTFDQQAAFDITSQLYSGMMSHVNVGMFSGFLETAMSGSLEAVVFADEAIGHLHHITRGFELDDDALGLDTVDEMGPGGNYLGTLHTLENYGEHWRPSLFVRQSWEAWQGNGAKDCGQRANDRVKALLANGVRVPLAEETIQKLQSIMDAAEAELKNA